MTGLGSAIVVGYNQTLPSGRALLEAGREAELRRAEVVVDAFDPSLDAHPDLPTETAVRETATATAAFGAGVLRHRYPSLAVHGEAIAGAPHEVLTFAARGAALLVLGVRGEAVGSTEQRLGPVPGLTLVRTPCPTMVVRGPERRARGVVLAAIDVAEQADEVVNFAFVEARLRSAKLRAVSVIETSSLRALVGAGATEPAPEPHTTAVCHAQASLDRILAERQARCAVRIPISRHVLDGSPTEVLADAARRADVVVTGARRRDGTRHGVRLGTVTQALLCGTACPVIVVPFSSGTRQ